MTDKTTETKTEVKPEVKETEEQKKLRIDTCVAEVNLVLTKYNCSFVAYMIVTGTGNVPKIEVISK